MNDPRPVILFDGDRSFCNAIAFRRLACVLAVAGLLCVSSAQGQVIREEGFPVKGGVAEESAWAPVVQEECDPFTVPGEFGESCAPREKTPDPFGFGPEGEARPGESSGPAWRTPPRLECPAAIFLEELETGQVECHAWDASGEEHLEYSWEPVGNTTRDYLNNPRLIPEDSPTPSVVAPETPSYETLESFYSGETTFLYRYRLTATSRATGLSSWREVEVYVSGSRPSVYCPLEVSVEEGETIALDCEGADPLSHRMDYDEDGASILWEWEGLWGASTSLLDATDRSSALFTAPAGSAGEEYHYIASMTSQASGVPRTARRRVTVTVRVVGGEAVGDIAATNGASWNVDCTHDTVDNEYHFLTVWSGTIYHVDEGDPDFTIQCRLTAEPGRTYTWSWTAAGGTANTSRLSAVDISSPVFDVPENVNGDTEYRYWVIASDPPDVDRDLIRMHVRDTGPPPPSLACTHPDPIYEGTADITLDCSVTNEPTDAAYAWTGTHIADRLSGTDGITPTFSPPGDIDEPGGANKDYEYTVTMTAGGVEQASEDVIVTVLEKPDIYCSKEGWVLSDVFEGNPDTLLYHGCESGWQGAPVGSNYTYAWTARGSTPDTHLLSATNIETPTFYVPDTVGSDETYEYTLTVSAANADDYTRKVTVTVEDRGVLVPVITCNDSEVYEGAADFTLDCSVTNEPTDAAYAWTGTHIADRLSGTDGITPTFSAPGDIDEPGGANKDYEYTVTMTAGGVEQASEDVIVTVLEKPDIYCLEVGRAFFFSISRGEGSPDFPLRICEHGWAGAPAYAHITTYAFAWTALNSTPDTALLSAANIEVPTFNMPDAVDEDEAYEYTLTVSAANADDVSVQVGVYVLDTDTAPPPSITCNDSEVYEGAADITLDCSVANEPTGAAYSWAVRGSTSNTNDLSSTTILQPTFAPPGDIAESGGANKDYEYTVTLSAGGVKQASEEVTVTVLEKPNIYPPCGITGYSFISYEGGADFQFTYCPEYNYTGAPGLSPVYRYNWTTRGSTPSTAISLLSATDVEEPFFRVPDAVSEDKRYEYTMTVSADNADPFLMSYAVNVKNKPPIVVTCEDPDSVYEGSADFTLDCSVENEPSDAAYSWTGADVANRLTGTDSATPTFAVPRNINETRTYSYRLTVSGGNTIPASADVTVTVLNKPDIVVTCPGNPYSVYEGSGDFELDCSASGAPGGSTYGYVWTARGSTTNTDMLSRADIASPTFYVPEEVDATTYEYLLTASAENAESGSADVTVTVLNKPDIVVTCPGNPYSVYEGSGDFELDCSASGAPGGSTYGYVWTARGSTTNTDMLSRADIASPTFYVPEEVDATTYEYLLTASAENAESGSAEVTVTVLNRGALAVICADPGSVYEGSADIAFDCSASGVPAGSAYEYAWTARGATTNTALLSGADIASPTFAVPDALDATTTYEYLLTASADGAESTSVDVEVKVLNRPSLAVACSPVAPVYEGSKDFALDCAASGAPGGSTYGYAWTVRGSTTNTDLLGRADIASPVFYVPEEVDATTTYEYLLTARAENAESGSAAVTVTVLNVGALRVVCADPPSVYEGSEDIAFDCAASGAPGGSAYEYEWTGRGSTTDTALLSAADGPAPTFDVPGEVDEDETYEYLLTVSAENADPASADVTVTVLNKGALALACADPGSVYEGSEDIAFDCAASGAPGGSAYEYEWTARNGTANTDLLIAGADGPAPTFDVPEEVDATTTYEYTLTVSAENADPASADVTVTVLNKGALALACADPGSVYEGSSDIAFDCSASGAPGGSTYGYAWTARGSTTNTDMLSGADIASPVFAVPEEVDATTTYEYTLTVSAENADPASADVTVTVLNKGALALACADPGSVYEGSSDIAFDCSASGAPGGSTYGYAWTARGSTTNTSRLSAADIASPTFYVPDEVAGDETYEYTLTVSAENADPASTDVTVKVLNKGALALVCADPGSVYEGSADFALDCTASGAPAGSAYEYEWTARSSTTNTDMLSRADIASPVFAVPEEVDATTTYEYLLTASAENAEDATAEVTVKVLNRGALAVACADPGSVYEGSEDFALDCSASGAPAGSAYEYAWTARGSTTNTALLSAADVSSPTFYVPDALDETTTYEYLLTASAENAESATAEVTVTVLNRGALSVVCVDPPSVYEGSEDFDLDCAASGAPAGSAYVYSWIAQGATPNTSRLSAADIPSPTFYVPDEVAGDETYEYTLTVSAENADPASTDVTVKVLNKGALALVCADPGSVYEGSADIAFDCSASGAPAGSTYGYAWTARGSTTNTDMLSRADIASPVFAVPEEVDATTTYEYLLTARAENSMDAAAEVSVTVLNKGALALVCADPGSVYEGSADIAFDCSASGAPGDDPQYTYAWAARGDTPDTALLSAADVSSPMFLVPEEVDEDETYEYTLTVSADNAESVTEDVTVTVLDRIRTPAPDPVSPPGEEPPADPLPPVAESSSREPSSREPSSREPSDPSALGVTVSASSLRFGVQSSETRASLDPLTDGISTRVSGPYHAGRMTLSPGGGAAFDENGEMALSIELASPVVLRREGGIEGASIVLAPSWSFAESCEQLSSQAIGGLYTEATLTEGACRLLRFGGELDLTDTPSGRYAGSMDIVLRSGESEETHSVEVEVTVVPSQRVITIGPGGVRFSTSRELAAGLTEGQNLSIYPDVAFLTEGKPHGVFELSNPSLVPLEVSVSARFGYTEATRDGREVVVEDASGSHLGDLSQVVDIHPAVVVLQPGEKGLVRYGVQEEVLASMSEQGYAAFFDVVSSPRQYVRSDRMPEEVTGERTARVTMRVPGVYVPGEGASQLRATLLSISYVGSLSATFLLETQDRPFVGEVLAYDGEGRELGRRETLVYTRSRVRVPLDRMPEGDAVFLRFSPRGPGRVPDPAAVRWNAPRRDVGAVQNESQTLPSVENSPTVYTR